MKISDTLWAAANEKLWDGVTLDYEADNLYPRKCLFSCDAIRQAYASTGEWTDSPAIRFSALLGLDCNSLVAFDEFEYGAERQGARYLWLDFARLVAEDEGL